MTAGRWSEEDEDGLMLEPEERAALFGLSRLPAQAITREMLLDQWAPRIGRTNPERVDLPLWREQMRTFKDAWEPRKEALGEGWPRGLDPDPLPPAAARARARVAESFAFPALCPTRSFQRFGRSVTELPDGRLVLIAGEHEDFLDDDFCVYADVTVIDPAGDGPPQVDHYIYPEADFPPTDFHSATLVGEAIWLVGNLGYGHMRRYGETQVLRLNLADFSVRPVAVPGPCPGWIERHEAELMDGRIVVSGGWICTDPPTRVPFTETWALDPQAPRWERIG